MAQIAAAMARFTRDDLLAALEKEGIPAGPINTVEQAFNDVQARHRGLETKADGIPGIRNPIRLSGSEVGSGERSPGLDEHGETIRKNLWD